MKQEFEEVKVEEHEADELCEAEDFEEGEEEAQEHDPESNPEGIFEERQAKRLKPQEPQYLPPWHLIPLGNRMHSLLTWAKRGMPGKGKGRSSSGAGI